MSFARYLSKLGAMLGSDGKVPTAGLADGAVTAIKMATGAVLAQLGFTPMAGDGNYNSVNIDFNTITTSGVYRIGGTSSNGPGSSYGQLLVMRGPGDTITQIYGAFDSGTLFTRSGNPPNVGGSGAWTSWKRVVNSDVNICGGTLTNVTGSRANSTTYTNSTGRPLIVYCSFNNTNGGATLYINGSIVRYINGYGNGPGVTFIVPPGATYQVAMGSAVNQWWEY